MRESYEFMRMPARSSAAMTSANQHRDSRSAAMRHHLLNDDMETTHMPAENAERTVSRFPEKTPIGMAYVPVQQWGDTYSPEEALCRGTLFPEIDYPFGGGDCAYE